MQRGPCALGLSGHRHAKLRPADPLGEAWIILDFIRPPGLAARHVLLIDIGRKPGPRRVKSRRQPRGARADDQHIPHRFLLAKYSSVIVSDFDAKENKNLCGRKSGGAKRNMKG